MFYNCAPLLLINGNTERIVSDQILSAHKAITERMSKKSQLLEDIELKQEFVDMMKSSSVNYSRMSQSSKRYQKFK